MYFPRLTPFVRQLLIVLFGLYVTELIVDNWVGFPMFRWLALDPYVLGVHTLWQVWTHVLVVPPTANHVFAFLINLVFLWWIASPFEERYGGRRTAQLCVVAALSAALPAVLVGQLLPGGSAPLFGSGPLTLAAIAAFAYGFRHQGQLSLFGVVSLKPMHVIYLLLGISLLFFLASRNLVELVADVGAVGGAILFVRWMSRPRLRRQP
ncbi:MAG: rhomboid family intramembrane serine protease, partial [Polyangiales bacterium]